MRTTLFICFSVLMTAAAAFADVRDFIGRPVSDVRVEAGGQTVSDPAVLELIETRIGEPLRVDEVRETIDHLIGLGRFEDVRVFAEAAKAKPGAVALRWVLTPVLRIEHIELAGETQLDKAGLRGELVDRVGARPSMARLPEIVDALRAYYSDRGFRSPRLTPRVVPGDAPELIRLVLMIDAGPRTRLGHTRITGAPPANAGSLVSRFELDEGRPYDRPGIQARLVRYEDELRALGYYEASVDSSVVFSEDNATASVTVEIDPGPRVRVVFAGDPLPASRRETLVPIRQERSVDLDLLEDASRNIESFLRQQGYRTAQAPYAREQRGGDMILTFTVSRGPLHTVASSALFGNDALSDGDLAGLLALQRGEPFVDSRVATIAAAITELYRVRGFAQATVRPDISLQSPRMENGQEHRPVAVRFLISEGLQTIVGGVSLEGMSALPEARARSVLSLTSGKPFYRPQLEADRTAIERLYRNEGFQDVRVTTDSSVQDEGRRVDLRWTIREGPRTMVDHVLVSGNERTTRELIRREVVIAPGKPLGEDAIVESQRRLAALGLFRRVRITELPHGASTSRDMLIEVEEVPSTTISEGGGIEAVRRLRRAAVGGQAEARFEVAPRAFVEVSRRNLWGKNRTLSLFTRVSFRPRDPAIDSTDPSDRGGYGFNEYRIVGTFREPRAFKTSGEAQLTAFVEQAVRSSFNFRRSGGRAEYARRLGTAVTVTGRYTFDYTQLFDEQIRPEERLLVDRLFPQVRLSTFTGSLLRDSRNDGIDPERGTLTGVDASVAPKFAGSEVGFVRTFVQSAVYRRLPGTSRFIVAAAARLGLGVGFERALDRLLPASERFFAGGDTTVRGFVLDQLGASDTLNDQGFPTGGNGLIVLNLELRSPYWKGVGGVGFFDAGNVFKQGTDVSLTDLRPTAGFGIRYKSPVGPVRVDLGFNLDRRLLGSGVRERGSVLHISLGQAF